MKPRSSPARQAPAETAHGIPAIDRAVAVLDAIGAAAAPPGIAALAGQLRIPRSTVYRLLNSLAAHDMVGRDAAGGFVLGARLLRLSRAVPRGHDLVSLARPVLERLAVELDAAVKLSIVDGNEALVVLVAESPRTYSVTTKVGRRFPLHAGAASKAMAAHFPPAAQAALLAERLPAHTPATITDPAQLRKQFARIRRERIAEDRGEFAHGIFALAAPVFDAAGSCVAAVSVPFFASEPAARAAAIRKGVAAAAAEVSTMLGG
jgi:DNA-binding IclR family transcriptional regulator